MVLIRMTINEYSGDQHQNFSPLILLLVKSPRRGVSTVSWWTNISLGEILPLEKDITPLILQPS